MLEIKKAGVKDIEIIRQLTYTIWPDAYGNILQPAQLDYMLELIYSKTALTNQIENLQHQFILLFDDHVPVGFASYSPKNKADHHIFRLHKIYLLPNQQGKGSGRFLLNFIIAEIKKTGATQLELNVNRQNKARLFYEKNGFTILREENIDIGNGYFMNDYIMQIELVNS